MIPRGEVGLIFASIGKGLGVITFRHRYHGYRYNADYTNFAEMVFGKRNS